MSFLQPFLLAAVSAAALGMQDPSGATLAGVVRSELTGDPLRGAVVELAVGAASRLAVADGSGHYSIDHVPPGRSSLSARHAGHQRLEFDVWMPAEGRVTVDLTLAPRPVALPPVTATARRGSADMRDGAEPAPGLALIGISAASGTPGLAELGLTEFSGGSPPDPADPGSVLYVRGASTDIKMVLLDGAPVHAPFHLGGVIEPFEPMALGAVNMHLGGAPSRHHGGLAYVLELESNEPRSARFSASGGMDMLSARGVIEAPMGAGAGMLLAGRRLHGGGATLFLEEAFPYGYYDALGRADVDVGGGRLAMTGFVNRERVRLGFTEDGDHFIGWGNTAGSVRYRSTWGDTDVLFTVGSGRFEAEVPYVKGGDTSDRGNVRRTRIAADALHHAGDMAVSFGTAFETYTHEQRFAAMSGTPRRTVVSGTASGNVLGMYAEAGFGLGDRVVARGGSRAELFSGDASPYLAPRLSLTWMAGDEVTVTLAAGRHNQHVRMVPVEAEREDGVQLPPTFGATEFHVASANDITLSLDQKVAERVRLGMAGYVKQFNGVALPVGGETIRSSGVDVTISGAATRISGWAGYSLAWIWSTQSAELATPLFSGRHVLSAGLRGDLGAGSAFDVGVVYGAGLPHSAIIPASITPQHDEILVAAHTVPSPGRTGYVEGGELDPRGELDRPYLRLDASIRHSWSQRLGDRDAQLTTYLRLLNALDRRDAIFYLREGQDARPLSALPILPVLGFEWVF